MTTAIRLYRTYILSTFVPLNTIRRLSGNFLCLAAGGVWGTEKLIGKRKDFIAKVKAAAAETSGVGAAGMADER